MFTTFICQSVSLQSVFVAHRSPLAPHHSQADCIETTVNKIVELSMSLVYCVVQFSFYSHDPPRFPLLTLELKGLSLIHVHDFESGSHHLHL